MQHYPDGVCRVCRQVMYVPKTNWDWFYMASVFLVVHYLISISQERLLVKLFFLAMFWNIGFYYSSTELTTSNAFTGLVCLWMVFVPGGNPTFLSIVLATIGIASFLYTLSIFVPTEHLLRAFSVLLGFIYAVGFVAPILLVVSMTPMFVMIATVAYVYTLFGFIPPESVLRIIGILLLFLYGALLSTITFTRMENTSFVLYLTLMFLIWNAAIRGGNPVRLFIR